MSCEPDLIQQYRSCGIPSNRVSKHLCVVCASPAELYCARCELAPYCGPQCQRSDWIARHSSVCHNLIRLSKAPKPRSTSEDALEGETSIQPAMPLRKPHPAAQRENATTGNQTFSSPNHTQEQKSIQQNRCGSRNNDNKNNNNRNSNNRNNNSNKRQEKNAANNYRKNNAQNGVDTQFNYTSKPTTNQQSPSPVHKEPSSSPTGAIPKVKAIPVQPELVQVAKQANSASSVTSERVLVPKNYLFEILSIGDTAMLSVEANAADCGTKQPGFVCLCLNEQSEAQFQDLCGPFGVLCAAAKSIPSVTPGETFAYFDTTDDAWYRARCLSAASAALLDGCKVVPMDKEDKYAALSKDYEDIPEFCCVLRATGVALGNSLKATLVSKTPSSIKVSLVNAETSAAVGEGDISRWLPDVEYPKPKPAAVIIPEVSRPDVTNNSKVLLVEASAVDRVLVRPADKEAMRRFDSLLEDVIMYGMKAQPLPEPPTMGQTVIGEYSDGLQYRALCRRTNVKQNKYLLEYIEFGNTEIAPLEKLYPCPPELTLTSLPTQVSLVKLQATVKAFTAPATQYLEKIRDDNEELVLTVPSGAKSAPTGAEICLIIAKNKESINRKVIEMCTPEWKKLEESGGDVLESEVIMNDHLEYLELPADGCELDVLDVTPLACGTVSACERGSKHAQFVLGSLTERMAEYCNSQIGTEPYLPSLMEVCIAKCPPYPQWFRAVLVDHKPGDPEAKVCYVDYGNIETVSVSELRKMLPEFVRDVPALALHVEIRDFPKELTPQQLGRAITHMEMNEEGRGTLRVTRCLKRTCGVYDVDAPELLEAMRG